MTVAVVPVKRLSDAKSRLSTHLSSEERASLVTALLRRTVALLQGVDTIERIGVATEERELVDSLNLVDWLPDVGGLNPSLAYAAAWATEMGARSMLVVPCDLPFLEGSDLRALMNSSKTDPSVSIAPTRDGGTGAILLSPPQVLDPAFGLDSFRRHIEQARTKNISIRTVVRDGFSRDLDTMDDLAYLDAHVPDFRCLTS